MRWTTSDQSLLFHATDWAPEILSEGFIRGNPIKMADHVKGSRHHLGVTGICATRCSHFARLFAPAVLLLDQAAIRMRFRSLPRAEGAYDPANDHGDFRIEAEQLIIAERLPLSTYCRGLWLCSSRLSVSDYKPVIASPLFRGFFKGHHG